MRFSEILGAAQIKAEPLSPINGDPIIDRVTSDSRKIGPTTLFVACKGATPQSKDGHAYLGQAANAAAVLVQETNSIPKQFQAPVWHHPNTKIALARLTEAIEGNPSKQLKIFGITGTSGKTTTTFFLTHILAQAQRKAAVLGTLGVGKPGELAPLGYTTPDAELLSRTLRVLKEQDFSDVTMEVSSHALATHRADGIQFEAAAFTNLSQDHLDFHGNMADYQKAKERFFLELLPKGKAAILPFGHPLVPVLKSSHQVLTWGADARADIRLIRHGLEPAGLWLEVEIGGQKRKLATKLFGDFNIDNMLTAAAIAHSQKIGVDQIVDGLATAPAVNGRLNRVHESPQVFIDYSHKPDALQKAIASLKPLAKGRLIVVFGCGGDRDAGKRPQMGLIAASQADYCFLTSDNPRSENPLQILQQILVGANEANQKRFSVVPERREAITLAIQTAKENDVVLIAGKGHETIQIIGNQTLHFDDAQEALTALKERKK